MKIFTTLCLLIACCITNAQADELHIATSPYNQERKWTSAQGSKINGALWSVSGTRVEINRTPNYEKIVVKLSDLSDSDQKFISDFLKSKSELIAKSKPRDIEGFRDYKWGAVISKDESFQLLRVEKERVGYYIRKEDKLIIGDIPLKSIVYTAVDGALASVQVEVAPTGDYMELRQTLVARYGGWSGDDRSSLWPYNLPDATGTAFLTRKGGGISLLLVSNAHEKILDDLRKNAAITSAEKDL